MTERPSKAAVDRALSFVGDTEWAGHDPTDDIYGVLAAEVLALRESVDAHLEQRKLAILENDKLREENVRLESAGLSVSEHATRLEATIARVEALPDFLDKCADASRSNVEYAAAGAWEDAAEYVRDALRGES